MTSHLLRRALPVLAGTFLLGSAFAAHAEVSFGVNIGIPSGPPPPPPGPVVQYASPGGGAVWIDGHWEWNGARWVWWRGYWDYPPTGDAVWAPGAVIIVDGRSVWRPAHWDHRGWDRGYYGHPYGHDRGWDDHHRHW